MNSITLSNAFNSSGSNNKLILNLSSKLELQDHVCCLDNLTIYYSWFNIKQSLNNNEFQYNDGKVAYNVTMTDGSYEISDINNYLHFEMQKNGHSTTKNGITTYPINLYANTNYYRVAAKIDPGAYQLMIPETNIRTLLGINAGTYKTTFMGQNVPQVENVESVFIHCNLVDNQYSAYSRLLFTFSPQKHKFGDLLSVTPNFPRWVNTFNTTFSAVEVWFTDQNNNMLDIIDPKITITLLLKPLNLAL